LSGRPESLLFSFFCYRSYRSPFAKGMGFAFATSSRGGSFSKVSSFFETFLFNFHAIRTFTPSNRDTFPPRKGKVGPSNLYLVPKICFCPHKQVFVCQPQKNVIQGRVLPYFPVLGRFWNVISPNLPSPFLWAKR